MTAQMLMQVDDRLWPRAAPAKAGTEVVRAAVYCALAAVDMLIVLVAFAASDLFRHDNATDLLSASYLLIPAGLPGGQLLQPRLYLHDGGVAPAQRAQGGHLHVRRGGDDGGADLRAEEQRRRVAHRVLQRHAVQHDGVDRGAAGAAWLDPPLGSRFFRRVLIVDGGFTETVPSSFERIDADLVGIRPEITDPLMLHRFSQLVAGADRVVVACPVEHRERWSLYLKSVDCTGELLVPELRNVEPLSHEHGSELIGVRVSIGRLDIRNRLLKRAFDLAIAVPVLVAVSPLMLAVAIAVKLESRGPILFRQQRMGRANQLFQVLKFRSMFVGTQDHDGAHSTRRDDRRITRVGRVIRATSIDELPQLLNVINGDMSLVGPRPHALGSRAGDELFWHVDPRYWLRHTIKPGLTGLAQVRGHRGATDHATDLTKRLESDIEYLSHWSLLTDATILVRTLFVLVHRNAY